MHRQGHAKVTDHRTDHVTLPYAVESAKRGAAAQTDSGCVDRFLSKRSESLALKRHSPIPDVAAGEERLEAIVGGAREDHPAQDLESFLAGDRGDDRLAAEEPVAVVEDRTSRLLKPACRGHARRRLTEAHGNAAAIHDALQLPLEIGAQRFDARLVVRLPATSRALVRRQGGVKGKRMPLRDEGAESACQTGQRFKLDGLHFFTPGSLPR